MKLRWMTAFIVLFAFFIIGCDSPEPEQEAVPEAPPEPQYEETEAVVFGSGNLRFFPSAEVNEEGRIAGDLNDLKSVEHLETVTYLGQDAERELNGSILEYKRIRTENGNEGWMWSAWLIPDAKPGVISSDARVYSEGKESKVTKFMVPPLQGVAVSNDEYDDNLVQVKFIPLKTASDFDQDKIQTVWVKANTITYDQEDIDTARLYALALSTDDLDLKKTRFEVALEKNSSFTDIISREYDALTTEGSSSSGTAAPAPTSFEVTDTNFSDAIVNADRVRVRNLPTTEGSEVLFELNQGFPVKVSERTTQMQNINGTDDYWYRITDSASGDSGWIFGAFIDEK